MGLLRLDPPVLLVTPFGHAEAHFLIEMTVDHDLEWVTFIQEGEHEGECWTWRNRDIRQVTNITNGRLKIQHLTIPIVGET